MENDVKRRVGKMYSLMLSLENQKVTIVGGGKVAYRKACTLMAEKCVIEVIAPEVIDAFNELPVRHLKRAYQEGDCLGSLLVFAATNEPKVNHQVFMECEKAHILCNVADDNHYSHFMTPAQVRRGDLTLSVSTGGKSPALAAQIKKELETHYGIEYEKRLNLLGKVREYIIESEKPNKKELLTKLAGLSYEALEAYVTKNWPNL